MAITEKRSMDAHLHGHDKIPMYGQMDRSAIVIPAYAGIQRGLMEVTEKRSMNAHLHGHDEMLLSTLLKLSRWNGLSQKPPQPLTQTTCFRVATTSTKSDWFAITSSMGL